MIEQYAEAQWDMNMSRKRTEADRGNFGSSVRRSYLAVRGMFYRIGGSAGTWWNGMLQCPLMSQSIISSCSGTLLLMATKYKVALYFFFVYYYVLHSVGTRQRAQKVSRGSP